MRLGFDLDGTVADLHGALAQEAARLFPAIDPAVLPSSAPPDALPTSPEDSSSPPGGVSASQETAASITIGALSARQQAALWRAVCDRENFWESLNEIEPGSLARLYELARAYRWEVIFLTSRPETRGDTAQMQSHRWLAAKGFSAPSVFVVHGSRGKIAASLALDAIVDDRPENCLDVAVDSKARPILMWRAEESRVPASARNLGIGSVHSMAECLDILETLDRPEPGMGGVVERLKRLLGLKPQAAHARHSTRSSTAHPEDSANQTGTGSRKTTR